MCGRSRWAREVRVVFISTIGFCTGIFDGYRVRGSRRFRVFEDGTSLRGGTFGEVLGLAADAFRDTSSEDECMVRCADTIHALVPYAGLDGFQI